MKNMLLSLPLTFALALVACGPQPQQLQPTAAAGPSQTPEPATATPLPTSTETPVPAQVQTYQDEAGRFSFDYPDGWMLDETVFGSRASGVQLSSWVHEPGQLPEETPPGGSILDVLVQLWDPKGDLAAFVAQRKSAWEASGIKIVSEQAVTLAGGRAAQEFTVLGVDGVSEGYFLFTTLGQDYLVFSGSGDLEALALIAHSVK